MKKTLTINLNGYVFNIDNDAYETLNVYLDKVAAHFADDERDEIMKDIEARIADLFTERLGGRNVVEAADVAAVIDTLGEPEQFDTDGDEAEPQEKPTGKEQKRKYRKLYRDPDEQMLGGVAAGLAAYLGWDVTAVRLLLIVVLVLGFGWIIPIYLLLWALLPEAKTAAQKLEMRGIEPNLENIRNYIQSDRFKDTAQRVGSRLGEVLVWTVKILLIVCCGMIGLALFVAAICAMIAVFAVLVGGSGMYADMFHTSIGTAPGTAILVSTTLLLLCPAIGLAAACVRLVGGSKSVPRRRWVGWTLLAVWIASLFTLIGTAIYCERHEPMRFADFSQRPTARVFDNADDSEAIIEGRIHTPFSNIEASEAVRVKLTQSDTFSVTVKAAPSDLRLIDTRVKDGTLQISNRKRDNIRNLPTVFVAAPAITSIKASEACSVESDSTLALGDISIDVSEASRIVLKGTAGNVTLSVEEASHADLRGLRARTLRVSASEASHASIGHAEKADLKATEASRIAYTQRPEQCETHCDISSSIGLAE